MWRTELKQEIEELQEELVKVYCKKDSYIEITVEEQTCRMEQLTDGIAKAEAQIKELELKQELKQELRHEIKELKQEIKELQAEVVKVYCRKDSYTGITVEEQTCRMDQLTGSIAKAEAQIKELPGILEISTDLGRDSISHHYKMKRIAQEEFEEQTKRRRNERSYETLSREFVKCATGKLRSEEYELVLDHTSEITAIQTPMITEW